jgi:putative transposase
MGEMGIMGPPRKRKRTTNSNHDYRRYSNRVMNLQVERPNQVWVGDITYIPPGRIRLFSSANGCLYPQYPRLAFSSDNGSKFNVEGTGKRIGKGVPEIHHSDQGVQYAATAYVNLLSQHGVAISMAEVGAAWQNSYAERLMQTIKEEEVDLSEYRNFAEAYQQIERFLEDVYVEKRIHSSLGYLTPSE